MTRVTLSVAEELLHGNALLLPDVYDLFCFTAAELSHLLKERVDTSRLVTAEFILSHLTSTLQHHMQYSCKVKKFGTLLFRPGSDLSQPLTQALWKVRQLKQNATPSNQEKTGHQTVLKDLNARACAHVKSFLSQHKGDFKLTNTTISNLIASIDRDAVCTLTMSSAEKKGSCKTSTTTQHSKLMRRFFIFCSLMFCINDKCTIPLHTLLTSIIDGKGGSTTLIKIMNQLGACSSADTLFFFFFFSLNFWHWLGPEPDSCDS